MLACVAISAYSQETRGQDIGVGFSLAFANTPEDKALSDASGESELDKIDFFFDFAFFRLGYNASHASVEFTAYQKSWDATLTNNMIYGAYRLYSRDGESDWDMYAMAGLVYVDSELIITNISSAKSTSIGILGGGGIFYYIGDFGFGPQLIIVSAQGKFDDVKVSTGFTQLQLGFRYAF